MRVFLGTVLLLPLVWFGCGGGGDGSDSAFGGAAGAAGAGNTVDWTVSSSLDGELLGIARDDSLIVTHEATAAPGGTLTNLSDFAWATFGGATTLGRTAELYDKGSTIAFIDTHPSFIEVGTHAGESSTFLTDTEAATFSKFDTFSAVRVDEAGEVFAFSTGSRLFVKRGDEELTLYPIEEDITDVGAFQVMQVSADGNKILLGHYVAPNIDKRYLWLVDANTGEKTPFVVEDATGTALFPDTNMVSQIVMNDEFTEAIFVAIGTNKMPEILHYELATKKVTPLFEGVAEHLAALDPDETPTIFVLGKVSFRGKLAAFAINGYSDAAYWFGNKNAYVADLESGETFAVGLAPTDIDLRAAEADAASPGAALTYFPKAGAPLSGDGWQYQNAHVSTAGDFVSYSALWSGGVSGLIVGPFTVAVARSAWIPLDG